MKVLLMFNAQSAVSASTAKKIKGELTKRGIDYADSNSGDIKKESDESTFLLLIAEKLDDLNTFMPQWRYFLNEIRWKRKKDGEVIILAADEVDLRRAPFALRALKSYPIDDISFLHQLKESEPTENANDYAHMTAQKNEQEQIILAASIQNNQDRLKAEMEQKRQRLAELRQNLDETKKQSSSSLDSSSKKFEGVSRAGSSEPPKDIVRTENKTYYIAEKKSNDEPFAEYQSPYKKKSSADNTKNAGCGIAIFLGAIFFFILIVVLNQ